MSSTTTNGRTILWCVPRSGSTILTKCLSGIKGMEIWFESFCFCYIARAMARRKLGRNLPAKFEDDSALFKEAAEILRDFSPGSYNPEFLSYSKIQSLLEASPSQHIFLKDMAYAMTPDRLQYIPDGFRHTFLIRHPLRVFHSKRKAMIAHLIKQGELDADTDHDFDLQKHDPLMPAGLTFKEIYDLWQHVRTHADNNDDEQGPVVIDGDELISMPDLILPKFCQAIGISYDESLLRWDSSTEITRTWKTPLETDTDLQATFLPFFKRSMTSSNFYPPSDMPSLDHMTPDVIRCTNDVIDYYNEIHASRITAGSFS